jgi:AmmeMemoRadiSam system protein B/AmmeMemoRadiSam system protein A
MPLNTHTPQIRPPAVAGYFYPAAAGQLRAEIDGYLEEAQAAAGPDEAAPKAIIAPHAGTVYSGPIAATAYRRLRDARDTVRRVVLLGPDHRVGFRGIAASSAAAFHTPLGDVPLDRDAIAKLEGLSGVRVFDRAHAQEHSLEVHLPFLQRTLDDFTLVPLVVGDATPQEVEGVLEALWDGPETLIVVSSDLSHYHDYDTCRRLDHATCRAIEEMNEAAIDTDGACGQRPVAGLLRAARRHGLHVATLDLRNSGDTAGPRDRVVGYGAWIFTAAPATGLSDGDKQSLRNVAHKSIRHGLDHGTAATVAAREFSPFLRTEGAAFVTLKRNGELRGCIGSLEPHRPLCEDVASNAWAAAFTDSRFPPLERYELADLALSISVLTSAEPLAARSEDDLLARLRPGEDGLIIEAGQRRATFLPQVWEMVPEPAEFLHHLKGKAGLGDAQWSGDWRFWRYGTISF